MLQRLQKEGITIVVLTPYMDGGYLMQSHHSVYQGEILEIDKQKSAIKAYLYELFTLQTKDMFDVLQSDRILPKVKIIYPFSITYHLVMEYSIDAKTVIKTLKGNRFKGINFSKIPSDIEDYFMIQMTKAVKPIQIDTR
ncbi:MAG: hypothetical protein ACMUEM_04050 [Flavobacteriales bacterium AspAUS03]